LLPTQLVAHEAIRRLASGLPDSRALSQFSQPGPAAYHAAAPGQGLARRGLNDCFHQFHQPNTAECVKYVRTAGGPLLTLNAGRRHLTDVVDPSKCFMCTGRHSQRGTRENW
jgi:hypothetical protein